MSEQVYFNDILKPRNSPCGIIKFMTRSWVPQKTFITNKSCSPQELKDLVAKSMYMDSVIESESVRTGIPKEKLKQEVLLYLDEIGMNKKMHIVRWMGILFLKILFMMKIEIYVSEPPILQLKSVMGKSPVLFLPTHRSYGDFCLLTYLCYHYDIDLPVTAAGMDFNSMWLVGRWMRDTGAFYIRRTLAGAPLYAATLAQYVRTLVARHGAPVEFFLEGTRSRSNKSLPPKYGMLSMSLLPLFAREVPDVCVVPVNLSYDRLLEHTTFAYEHLGVPKTKESTKGVVRSLRDMNDHFGNVYVNFGSPLSVKEYFGGDDTFSEETLKPADVQQLSADQFSLVRRLADHVVTLQQRNTVATTANLLAIVLMQSLMTGEVLDLCRATDDVRWTVDVLRQLGATVFVGDVAAGVQQVLRVHSKMMTLDREGKLRLLASVPMEVTAQVRGKMKGHILRSETLVCAVPVIQLQLYVNPVLHYLAPAALVHAAARGRRPRPRPRPDMEQLASDYRRIRRLLIYEFFYVEEDDEKIFSEAVEFCVRHGAVWLAGAAPPAPCDERLRLLLSWCVLPALASLAACADVMAEMQVCEHQQAVKAVQALVERRRLHPYCLSLEAAGNCLRGLARGGALRPDQGQEVVYRVVPEAMEECRRLINSMLPAFQVNFDRSNPVILDQRVRCRL